MGHTGPLFPYWHTQGYNKLEIQFWVDQFLALSDTDQDYEKRKTIQESN